MKRVSTPPSSPRRDDKQSFCTPERTHEYSLKPDRAKSPRNMLDCIAFGENNPNNVDTSNNNDALSMLANAAAAVKVEVETPKAHLFVVYRKKTNEFLSINPRKISKVKTNNNSGGVFFLKGDLLLFLFVVCEFWFVLTGTLEKLGR